MSTVTKRVELGRLLYSFGEEGLGVFVRSDQKNELIPAVCHAILINRPVSEVIQFSISRQFGGSSGISFFFVRLIVSGLSWQLKAGLSRWKI